MALTADTPRDYAADQDPLFQTYPILAATEIFEGGAIGVVIASGYARPTTGDTAVETFVGFARRGINNTGASGDKKVEVIQQGLIHDLAVTGATIDDVGKDVFADDDGTFTMTSGAGANLKIGRVEKFVSAGVADVRFKSETLV